MLVDIVLFGFWVTRHHANTQITHDFCAAVREAMTFTKHDRLLCFAVDFGYVADDTDAILFRGLVDS